MYKQSFSLLLSVCLMSSTFANDLAERAHTPPESPFHALSDETLSPPRSEVEYEGRATISTKYRFVYDEENDDAAQLYFDPNPESQSQLPYLTRWVFESDGSPTRVQWTEPAKKIWVTNVAEAALALLGKQLAEEVLALKH